MYDAVNMGVQRSYQIIHDTSFFRIRLQAGQPELQALAGHQSLQVATQLPQEGASLLRADASDRVTPHAQLSFVMWHVPQ
jgi:hypothetical protein